MQIIQSIIPNCYEIQPNIFSDNRGRFIKTFHRDLFLNHNLNVEWDEEYYSVSHKNVIRGMHFQLPPYNHEKLVYCATGAVFDVVIDLRKDSPTYKQFVVTKLNCDKGNMLYIPKGCAHGFKSLQDKTIMMYKVSTVYHPEADAGIAWDSCGINWSLEGEPIISPRDNLFIKLCDFESPF